jgi:hypothetical protein
VKRSTTSRWGLGSLVVVAVLAMPACGDDDAAAPPGTVESPATPTTDPADVVTCDVDELLVVVEEKLRLARLDPGGEWDPDTVGAAFAERTGPAEDFADLQGLDCAHGAVQRTDAGGERLLVAAWTEPRFTFVVQATDAPSSPYEPAAQFDLLIEWTRGEHLEGPHRPNREVRGTWAATMAGGETIVISAYDYSIGATAKHWQAGIEPPDDEDGYVTLEAERHGIERLRAAGARNVSIAELPEVGSEIGYVQGVTPSGQIIEARVAPPGWIDPSTEWHGRPVTVEQIGGVEVHVSEAGPPDDADILTYDVAHLSFDCGGHTWQVITGFGTTDELAAFVAELIEASAC